MQNIDEMHDANLMHDWLIEYESFGDPQSYEVAATVEQMVTAILLYKTDPMNDIVCVINVYSKTTGKYLFATVEKAGRTTQNWYLTAFRDFISLKQFL